MVNVKGYGESSETMRSCHGKINILFVIMQMEMGGSERLVHNLALKLDRELFNPAVAWFFGNGILREFKELNIPLFPVPKVKRVDFSTMQDLGNIIKNQNIHIVNAHHFMSMIYSFYGCKLKNRSKLIYTEHSEWELQNIPWKWRVIGKSLLKRTDSAVGVSDAVANRIKTTFRTDSPKIVAIQNGVDFKAFSVAFDKAKIKRSIGLSDDDRIIGNVANLKKVKNHLFLLEAFSDLLKEMSNVKLLLVGQGWESDPENSEKELRGFVRQQGLDKSVLFLGYRSDIPELLSIMDVYCSTSFKEGLPISLIEAMAAGLPSVGTDVEGIRDVIVHERTGLIVRLSDTDGLKRAMFTLLTDSGLAKRMAIEARSVAEQKYSLEQCTKSYTDLFLRCCDIGGKRDI
ncbi:MAG: glycosyltransferase family 4 protein [Thermodesulfovibrionales bacterium]|jgi:glycosyltransferase involved in cell wall biosynthesis